MHRSNVEICIILFQRTVDDDDDNERLTPRRTSRHKGKPSLGYDEMLTVDANAVTDQSKMLRSIYSGKSQSTIEVNRSTSK